MKTCMVRIMTVKGLEDLKSESESSVICLHDALEHAFKSALKHTPDNVPRPDSSQVTKHASEDALQFDTELVSKPAVGHALQTAYYGDLKYLVPPEDDDAAEQVADDCAITQADQAMAGASGSERQRVKGKVEGFDLECGRRIDNPVSLIKKVVLGKDCRSEKRGSSLQTDYADGQSYE